MNSNKLKHLEFLQGVITRMNTNSFQIKTWAITLVAALFALAAKDADLRYSMIVYFVIPVFWILDGFYISKERQYRDLYNDVRLKEEKDIDFDMNAKGYCKGDRTWPAGIISKTLSPFYGMMVIITLIIMFLLEVSNG
jgi:hypothetical protein